MSDAALPLPGRAPVPASRGKQWEASAALVVAAFFFGTTFVVVQDAIESGEPVAFLGVRFLIAAAVLGVVARRRKGTPKEARHGVVAGLTLLAGYVLQTIGLQYTTPATSAFVTYLLVPVVPVLAFVFQRQRPHPATLAAIALALCGLVLLTSNGEGGPSLGKGEMLTLGCAVMFATHILILGEIAQRHDPVRLTFVQLTTVGSVCAGWCVVTGDGSSLAIGDAIWAAIFNGVFATAISFLAMVWAQQVVSPSRAALILLMEPVFAAFLGRLTGDSLTVPKLLTPRSRSVRLEIQQQRRGTDGRSEEAESTVRPVGPP